MLGGHSMDALFGGVLKEDEKKKEEEAAAARGQKGKKKRVIRRRDENGKLVVVDPNSQKAEDILVTPGWMRNDPTWLQRKILEDAGLVEEDEEERKRHDLAVFAQPSEADREKAELHWEELGGLPNGSHERWDSSSSDDADAAPKPPRKKRCLRPAATDDPDIGSAPAKPIYNFCLNKNCPTYRLGETVVQQKWYGECCGMRNQASAGGGVLHQHTDEASDGGKEDRDASMDGEGKPEAAPMENVEDNASGSGSGSDEEWDITDDVLQDIATTDPETAQLLAKIKQNEDAFAAKARGPPEKAADVCPKDTAVVAALALLYLCVPYPESDDDGKDAGGEEGCEEVSEDEESEEDPNEFLDRCRGLLGSITVALTTEEGEFKPCEPFTTLSAELEKAMEDFTDGKLAFDAFQDMALRMIQTIRREFYVHKRASRPPNKKIVIDGVEYDI